MRCPINDYIIISKKNCKGCSYFDYDEDDGGEEGITYTPICTYKGEKEND